MKKITKEDAAYISERFYDFYDLVWGITKEVLRIRDGLDDVSLENYCIARHDKNIIVANYYYRGGTQQIQFPLHYLYDEGWRKEYKDKLEKEKREVEETVRRCQLERDLNDIERLRKIYPDKFK